MEKKIVMVKSISPEGGTPEVVKLKVTYSDGTSEIKNMLYIDWLVSEWNENKI